MPAPCLSFARQAALFVSRICSREGGSLLKSKETLEVWKGYQPVTSDKLPAAPNHSAAKAYFASASSLIWGYSADQAVPDQVETARAVDPGRWDASSPAMIASLAVAPIRVAPAARIFAASS